MDMYQKRKIRAEKKNNNQEEKLTKVVLNWYPGHMAKTKRLISENLNLIDVVYEVVDARMPYSSKIRDIDNFTKDKPRIMVMTKSDLCDIKETNKWVKYYEDKGYKVFLTSLEGKVNLKPLLDMTKELMEEKNAKRENKGMTKRRTRILIVGIPNVGKSTLINRLVGKKSAGVGNTPGFTKSLSWIRVNKDIELLDSPGILWPKMSDQEGAHILAALSSIKEDILNNYDVVEYILKTLLKYYPDQLENRYGITEVEDDYILTLESIGKRRGCLIKGGEIDYDKVVSIIINEVKNGTIKNITFDRMSDYE